MRGPIFASLILADEINRTPPKTQAALLEAMQERRVTVAGRSYDLPSPFFVIISLLATLIVAMASYRYVELPGRALLRRLGFPFAEAGALPEKARKKSGPGPRSGRRG